VLGGDGVSDVLPGADPGWPIPIHLCAVVGMGIHLIATCASTCWPTPASSAAAGEFLFVVAPLQIGGGTGSPVNPIAVL
jgi:hypothetical protein